MSNFTIRYENTGEIRAPQTGEWFISPNGSAEQARFDFHCQTFPIVRQVVVEECGHERRIAELEAQSAELRAEVTCQQTTIQRLEAQLAEAQAALREAVKLLDEASCAIIAAITDEDGLDGARERCRIGAED